MAAPRWVQGEKPVRSSKMNAVSDAIDAAQATADAAAAAIAPAIAAEAQARAAAIANVSAGTSTAYVDAKVNTEAVTRASAIAAETAARTTALAAVNATAQQALTIAQSASTATLDLSTIRDFASDAEAAAGGVLPGRLYRTGSVLHILPDGVIVDPGDGTTPIATRSITLSPKNLTGVALGTKTFTVTTTGSISSVTWVLRRPDASWETNEVAVPTTGLISFDSYMFQQNQTVRVWDTADYNMSDETNGISAPVSGGGTAPTPLPTGGGGGTVGDVSFIVQGQSNSVYFADTFTNTYKPMWKMFDAFRTYTGLTQPESTEHFARSDQAADYSMYSGSYTFHFEDLAGSDPTWLSAFGHDFNDPSTWANTDIMDAFVRYCTTHKTDVASDRPIGLIRLHSEYDSRHGSQGAAVYDAATREFFARYRAAIGRSVALSPIFLIDPAYDSGTNDTTMKVIRDVHRSQALDTSLGVFIINGSQLDAVDRSDASHWDDASAYRVADRAAVALAHWFSDNGYSRNDCSTFPRLGPTVTSIETVSGNTSALDLVFTHGGGADDLTIPSSPDYDQHKVLDSNSRRSVVGMSKVSGTRVRLALGSALTSSNVTYSFGERTPFSGPNSQITDNWHLKTKPSFTAGSTINDTRMIQNRYGGIVTLGGSAPVELPTGGGGGGTPVGYAGPPSGWVKSFEDTFSQPPALGVNALDGSKWKRREYGGGPAHGGGGDGIGVTWDAGYGLESTGSTLKFKVRREQNADGTWVYRCSGFMQGSSADPTSWAYHPGYAEFYVKFRFRVSHLNAQGVGGYMLMWPHDDDWTSEIDFVEMPGAQKNRLLTTMHADMTGTYDLGAHNDQAHTETSVDMTQWQIFEGYRTYRDLAGVQVATVRHKLNGVDMGAPDFFTDNPYLAERMVFGAAGFCGQTPYNQGWFTAPNPDDTSVTPVEFYVEMDYLEIWTPAEGESGGTIPADNGTGGGGGSTALVIGTLPTAQAGSHVYSVPVTGGTGTMSISAVNGGGLTPAFGFTGSRLQATVSGGLATFPALTLVAGQFYKVWDGNDYSTLTSSNSADSNVV